MASIIRTDALQNLNTSNIISQTNSTTLTLGYSGQTISIPAGATLTNNGTASGFGLTWQSVQTTGFTAVKGNAYPCNTTSAGFTVTLPATPAAGDQVQLVDYAGTFDTNALIISPNGNKLESGTSNLQLSGEREGITLTYIDSTQGWICSSGINEGTDALGPLAYSIDFLVVGGGGAGGSSPVSNSAAGGGGAGGYRTSTQTGITAGIVITVTVGDGGTVVSNNVGGAGSTSSISGSGLTTITSAGGGGGGYNNVTGTSGGSGGGGGGNIGPAGSGNTPSVSPSQGNNGATGVGAGGGGGGATAVGVAGAAPTGGAGGAGTASSITGSSVTRAGGGGGGGQGGVGGAGGSGGGGKGGDQAGYGPGVATGAAGTANTGGGGGAASNTDTSPVLGGNGGKGVVILSMPDASYSGTTTGSPTVATGVSGKTILTFTGNGSYTT
jgi:hypothetical protein